MSLDYIIFLNKSLISFPKFKIIYLIKNEAYVIYTLDSWVLTINLKCQSTIYTLSPVIITRYTPSLSISPPRLSHQSLPSPPSLSISISPPRPSLSISPLTLLINISHLHLGSTYQPLHLGSTYQSLYLDSPY